MGLGITDSIDDTATPDVPDHRSRIGMPHCIGVFAVRRMPRVNSAMAGLEKRVEMATFSNEAVLEALRRVQYRQVPWARRPGVFEYLRGLGLMETVRQRTVAPGAGFHAPVDIAVLTDKGRAEFARLAREERAIDWDGRRMDDYVFRTTAAVDVAR